MSLLTLPASRRQVLYDYVQLTKPRIVLLLVFTTAASLVVAARVHGVQPVTAAGTIIGGALAAAGASVLNQVIDRDMDAQMARTKHRPIPAGRVAPGDALLFGLGLLVWSLLILGVGVNWLAAGLALFGAVYYVGFYTLLLKRNSALNIIIGGGAGAVPVLVGWAAAAHAVEPQALILFAIVFLWTPPHSWALALYVNADYAHARVPMMPVAYGAETARLQIVIYTLHLLPVTLFPLAIGMLGGLYGAAALLLGVGFTVEAVRLLRSPSPSTALHTYKYSSLYLALLFLAMIADSLIRVG